MPIHIQPTHNPIFLNRGFTNKTTQQSNYRLSMPTTDLEKAGGDKGAAYPTGDISWKLPKHVL